MSVMRLEGKTAVVTGGSRGIGLAISKSLVSHGCRVMLCGRDSERVAEAVRSIAALGPVRGTPCDVGNHRDVQSLVKTTVEVFDGIDILINNAGVGLVERFEQMTLQQWRKSIDVNLTGVFQCCHAAVPWMKQRGGGHIVNIASRAGINAFAGGTAYCASKFGLIGLSEALFLELSQDDIRVSYVMPGPVNNGFGGGTPEAWHLDPSDIAQVVLDLLTQDSRATMSRVELRPAKAPYYGRY